MGYFSFAVASPRLSGHFALRRCMPVAVLGLSLLSPAIAQAGPSETPPPSPPKAVAPQDPAGVPLDKLIPPDAAFNSIAAVDTAYKQLFEGFHFQYGQIYALIEQRAAEQDQVKQKRLDKAIETFKTGLGRHIVRLKTMETLLLGTIEFHASRLSAHQLDTIIGMLVARDSFLNDVKTVHSHEVEVNSATLLTTVDPNAVKKLAALVDLDNIALRVPENLSDYARVTMVVLKARLLENNKEPSNKKEEDVPAPTAPMKQRQGAPLLFRVA